MMPRPLTVPSTWRLALAMLALTAGCTGGDPGTSAAAAGDTTGLALDGLGSDDSLALLDGDGAGAGTAPDGVAGQDAGLLCPGQPGCTCVENSECDKGLCIETPTGPHCAVPCTTDCPDGFVCKPVTGGGGDITTICVPRWLHLCDPCSTSQSCASLGVSDTVCVQQGAAGAFCGTSCKNGETCPSGYQCKAVDSIEGGPQQLQCVPSPESGSGLNFGVCACSDLAMQTGAQTDCYVEASDDKGKVTGKCVGKRQCTSSGLGACDVPPPGPELCNQLDDDCDGKTDENACDDKNPCTSDLCSVSLAGQPTCTHTPTPGSCDADSNACTGDDTCQAGVCVPGALKNCEDGNICTKDGCSAAVGCTHEPDDGLPCDDGKACTKADTCQGKVCQGEKELCDDDPCLNGKCDPATGSCNTMPKLEGESCEDGNPCTHSETCVKTFCIGLAKSCDDKEPCTLDKCDKATGSCLATPVDGPCDDGDACTSGDSCDKGGCLGTLQDPAKQCDDGNPCTGDACNPKTGCTYELKTGPCDDQNGCTKGDACTAGQCVGELIGKGCNDDNPCTDDTCLADGGCVFAANTKPCDDADACTEGDVCASKACVSGSAKLCKDADVCTDDGCDKLEGCYFAKIVGCVACQDDAGCNDNNPCSKDACDTAAGKCLFTGVPGACDDGDACTTGDTCAGIACNGMPKVCDDGLGCTDDSCFAGKCVVFANSNACDDGNTCTDGDKCGGGTCKPGVAKTCDDSDACTIDSCDPVKSCLSTPIPGCIGLPYSQAFACGGPPFGWTLDPPAVSGAAVWAVDGTPKPPGFASPSCSLNFNNGKDYACATGQTEMDAMAYSPTFDATALKPGTAVRLQFQRAGVWEDGTDAKWDNFDVAVSTDAGKTWTLVADYDPWPTGAAPWNWQMEDLSMVAGKKFSLRLHFGALDCTANATSGAFVDDLSILVGPCQSAAGCNDGNPCTTDACDVASGKCTWTANAGGCEDGDPCTAGEKCQNTVCMMGVASCDDGNDCTTDACGASGSCTHTNTTAACSDGDACTVGDACAAGKCSAGTLKDCDDKNGCTTDACSKATGACSHVNTTDPCNDNDSCTAGDTCKAGVCVGTPIGTCDDGNLCTDDSCSGSCTYTNNSKACNDNSACTQVDQCSGGACKGSSPPNCDDGNPCTTDSCNPSSGCTHSNNSNSCSDGNACTSGDVCGGGSCQSGGSLNCNDNNACTDDSCSPASGCVHNNNSNSCNDNNACTQIDQCSGGSCKGSGAPNCSDGNPCTTDSCNASGGCVNSNNGNSCSDGNACTSGDACSGGSCQGGGSISCNDGNPCTNDSCNSSSGCQYTSNSNSCSDGNSCTTGDQCSGGQCVGGTKMDCSYLTTNCKTGLCSGGSCTTTNKSNGTNCGTNMACSSGVCQSTCSATAYWTPTSTSATISGKPSGAPSLTAELGLSGKNVRFRTCKTSGTFTGPLLVWVGDWISGYYVSQTTSPAGSTCSAWMTMGIDYAKVKTGSVLSAQAVRIVSPSTCDAHFDDACNEKAGQGCGYCFYGSSGKMTATCLWGP